MALCQLWDEHPDHCPPAKWSSHPTTAEHPVQDRHCGGGPRGQQHQEGKPDGRQCQSRGHGDGAILPFSMSTRQAAALPPHCTPTAPAASPPGPWSAVATGRRGRAVDHALASVPGCSPLIGGERVPRPPVEA